MKMASHVGLLLLTLWSSTAAAAPQGAAVSKEPSAGFVEVAGGKLWYEEQGQGTPMVFLHDGLLPSATWDEQFPLFAKSFRAIRYDRRGYGRSAPAQGPHSDIEDLAAVFAAGGIERAILVGCSNGSKLAVDFALAYPDRVEALVLVGPVVSGLPYSDHFLRRGLANYRPMFREKSLEKLIGAWVDDPFFIAPANTRAKERMRELLTQNPGSLTGATGDSKPAERPAAGRLAEIRRPTLILVGEADIPDVHAQAGVLEAGIARARRVVIPGAGHLVHLEKPAEVNDLLTTFLRPGDAASAYLKTLQGDRTYELNAHLFGYDAAAPLDIQEAKTDEQDGVRVVDLSYASPQGGRVPGFLVLPPGPPGAPGEGKHPAVLFLHPGQGDRSTFVAEAIELAKRGIVSLTVSAPFLRPENKGRRGGNPWDPEANRKEQVQTVVDLRRGFDLLTARPEVDPARLAYVGHSLGATVGGTLAGVEKRPVAYVLMAGFPSLTHASTHGQGQAALAFQELLPPDQQKAYVAALGPIDALHYIGHAAPAKLLFQFAHRDEFITYRDAATYLQAASNPREVKWYDTDHFFNDQAKKDRGEWLGAVLGVGEAGKK